MKRFLLFILSFVICTSMLMAEVTFDFDTALPNGWTATVDPRGYDLDRGAQFASSSVLTLPGLSEVKKVTVICSANRENIHSMEVAVGEQSFGKIILPKENNRTCIFTAETPAEGALTITITRGKDGSVWIKQVVIDGEFDESVIPVEDLTEGLDPDYQYAEPTKVFSEDTLGSKIPYTFICNNVKVIASKGTKASWYFGANAVSTLTFVTTKPMKGIVVDGQVRKAFSATVSAGTLAYHVSGAVDLERDSILVVKDVNTNVLTLTCDKQLRCYEVRVYFDENPDVTIEEEQEIDPGYTLEWEPEEHVSMNITFDELQYTDMSENLGYDCTSLLFNSPTHEMALVVFAATTGDATVIPAGVYPINYTYEPGTVQASVGGDEYMDIPSYVATDFQVDDEGQELYNPYYLVSGALEVKAVDGGVEMTVQAGTYYGSTVNATYRGLRDAVDYISADAPVTKLLRDGQMIIQRDNRRYNVLGATLAD